MAGRTENQLGGGVCQVASAIYWCTLKADLEVLERYEHQFVPDYVPWGMDATIYWGSLDYRFRNNTAYPMRIDASVSNGYVHITFVGTDTKDYTVKLDYKTTAYYEHETVDVEISPDMKNYEKYKDYKDGDVIQWGYSGAKVTTYRYKYDKDGNLLKTEIVNYSNYDTRNKEIARLKKEEETTETPTEEPTEPTEPTEAPSEPTTPPEPTEPTAPTEQTDTPAAP